MQITFLGTGTSGGVPTIGCGCAVCRSADPRDKRFRSSLYVREEGTHVVIDTTPDFRSQALRFGVQRVDAVLFTHSHADHMFGFDDIRRYNVIQNAVIPAYANAEGIADLKRVFNYVGTEELPGLYRPRVAFRVLEGPVEIGPLRVRPLPVEHGPKPTLCFRVEGRDASIGYAPDCHAMPPETVQHLRGVDVMILDALKPTPHPTHLALAESLDLLAEISPGRAAYLIHMCHRIGHAATERALPPGVHLSCDGLQLELPGEPGA